GGGDELGQAGGVGVLGGFEQEVDGGPFQGHGADGDGAFVELELGLLGVVGVVDDEQGLVLFEVLEADGLDDGAAADLGDGAADDRLALEDEHLGGDEVGGAQLFAGHARGGGEVDGASPLLDDEQPGRGLVEPLGLDQVQRGERQADQDRDGDQSPAAAENAQ